MRDPNRELPPDVMEVLCAFVCLSDQRQQAFNGAMNAYLLASPAQRRHLHKSWQDSLEASSHT
jgi:hypothetical protein